jgi:hypothetical protein
MKKSLFILLGFLVIFLIIYFLFVQKEKKIFSPGRTENFLNLDSATVDRIEFRRFQSKLAFQKENQRWYMVSPDSHRADSDAMARLVGLASNLAVGEMISSNPGKQYWFQVDTLTGTGLYFFGGNEILASLIIGKMSDDRMSGYLRKTDSYEVYLTSAEFVQIGQRSIDQWRDRAIFNIDAGQIKEIEWDRDGNKSKLTKEDTLYQVGRYPYQEMSEADSQKVANYVQVLALMKADAFPYKSQLQEIEFDKGKPLLTITLQDETNVRLFVVKTSDEDNKYYVKTDQDNSVFTLFEYNFKQLTKDIEDFLTKEEP